MSSYTASTHEVLVQARPIYLREQSSPKENVYIWAYEVKIQNQSRDSVQLVNRYWSIMDSRFSKKEVRGPGVIGLQPVIEPHQEFTYSSFCLLNTPSGKMSGYYEMQFGKDDLRRVAIPEFKLVYPCRLVSAPPLSAD